MSDALPTNVQSSSKRRFLHALTAAGIGGIVLPSVLRNAQALAAEDGGKVKLAYCLRRLPNLSREEFQKYWFEKHGPLVRSHAKTLNIRRYIQLHSLDDAMSQGVRSPRQSPEPYDGVAELWWDSFEEFAPAQNSPERLAAGTELLEDERKFIDLPKSPVWLGRERVIVG